MNETVQKLIVDKTIDWFMSREGDGMAFWKKALIGFVALVAVAYLSYRSWRQAKNLSKARHARDVAEEKLHQATKDWQIAKNDDEVKRKTDEITQLQNEIAELDKKSEQLDKDLVYEKYKTEAIRNFGDMSDYLHELNLKLNRVGR